MTGDRVQHEVPMCVEVRVRSTVRAHARAEPAVSELRFTCPCCGYRTLSEPPGSHATCSVCFWEDDPVQLLDPSFQGGANRPSLMECQANYQRIGASEERFVGSVRAPTVAETRDPEWRPAQKSDLRWSRAPRDLSAAEYTRIENWYYWRRESNERFGENGEIITDA